MSIISSYEDEGALSHAVSDCGSGVAAIFIPCDENQPENLRKSLEILRKKNENSDLLFVYDEANIRSIIAILIERGQRDVEICDLLRQGAELRHLHEELQHSFALLRDFYYREGLSTPRIFFQSLPTEYASGPGDVFLTQRLPVDAGRLYAVSLFVAARTSNFCEGLLHVRITCADVDICLGSWELPFPDLEERWNTFVLLERPALSLRKNVLVEIYIDARGAERPTFAFGDIAFQPKMAAVADGQPQTRGLAIKCWTALPGSKISVPGKMWPVVLEKGRILRRVEVIPGDGQDVVLMSAPAAMDFDVVKWDSDRRWILVHPLGKEPTVAKLCDALLPGTQSVSVEVETAHDGAGPVEYAIAVARGNDTIPPPNEWLTLPTRTPSSLMLEVSQADTCMSLFLFTRIPEGSGSDYCWAHFKRIFIEGNF